MHEYEEWVEKCLSCAHCYKVKADDEELRCRCRKGCNYKKFVSKMEQKEKKK